jgi:hypothetical protein
MRRFAALAVALGLSLLACSSDDDAVSSSPDASSQSPTTQTVGPSGGTVTAGSVSLTIPPGALAGDTTISITPGGTPIPTGYTALSQLYTFGPDGTHFLKPITATFTLTTPGTAPTVYWSNSSGGYDALATAVNGTTASASVDHFSHAFCGERKGSSDAGAADAGNPPEDSGGGGDANPGVDSGATDAGQGGADAGADDAGSGGSDSGGGDAADAGGVDAGAGGADSGATDAGSADAGATDAGGDGSTAAPGISATVDGTPTSFSVNQKVTLGNGTTTIQADDSASTTHWTLQMVTTGVPQEVCQPTGNPVMTYTHYTNGANDALYSTQITSGTCTIFPTSNPAQPGDHAKGTFSATIERANAPLNSPVSHVFTSGSFDVVY